MPSGCVTRSSRRNSEGQAEPEGAAPRCGVLDRDHQTDATTAGAVQSGSSLSRVWAALPGVATERPERASCRSTAARWPSDIRRRSFWWCEEFCFLTFTRSAASQHTASYGAGVESILSGVTIRPAAAAASSQPASRPIGPSARAVTLPPSLHCQLTRFCTRIRLPPQPVAAAQTPRGASHRAAFSGSRRTTGDGRPYTRRRARDEAGQLAQPRRRQESARRCGTPHVLLARPSTACFRRSCPRPACVNEAEMCFPRYSHR